MAQIENILKGKIKSLFSCYKLPYSFPRGSRCSSFQRDTLFLYKKVCVRYHILPSLKSQMVTYFTYCYAPCLFSCNHTSWDSPIQAQFFLYFYSFKYSSIVFLFTDIPYFVESVSSWFCYLQQYCQGEPCSHAVFLTCSKIRNMELLGEGLCAFVLVTGVTPNVLHRSCANIYTLSSKVQMCLSLCILASMGC